MRWKAKLWHEKTSEFFVKELPGGGLRVASVLRRPAPVHAMFSFCSEGFHAFGFIFDPSSRVVVCGDLSAGASALVASGIPVGAAGLNFSDVPATAAFYTEIMWVAERGIISGFADGTFRPLALMNRGSMAATLHKLAGSPSYTAPRTSYFQDVPLSHPFFKQISWMVDSGVTYGWGDGSFRPGDPVTRDAVAASLYRMAGSPGYIAPSVSPYTDIGPGSAYYKGMCWMASMGISKGWPDDTLRPVESVQRNALCAFLYRYRKNVATAS